MESKDRKLSEDGSIMCPSHAVRNSQYRVLVGFCITIILAVIVVFNSLYIHSLHGRILQKDETIDALLQSDTSMIQKTVTRETYFVVGKQEMNSTDFLVYINSILQRCYAELDSLSYYREYYNMTQKNIGATLERDSKDSTGCRYIYSYPKLKISGIEVDSLIRESQIYHAILKRYPINIEDGGSYLVITSPQIDSALLLLPYFRKNLKSMPNNTWTVTYYE